jgi:hypothetical protein
MGCGRIGCQIRYLLKETDSLCNLSHFHFRFTNRCQRCGILWRERDRFFKFLLSVGFPVLLGKDQSEVQMALLVVRIVLHGLAEEFLRRSQLPFLRVKHREISARLYKSWLQVKRSFKPLLRGLRFSFGQFEAA